MREPPEKRKSPPAVKPEGKDPRLALAESPSVDSTRVTIPDTPPRGPKAHKAMAKRLGIKGNKASDLIVLQPNNDPYYKGTPAHVRDADWFLEVWEECEYRDGVHLRRIHYRLVSTDGAVLPSGTPYENNLRCWSALCTAASAARILGKVDVEAFVDRRNAPAQIFRERRNGNGGLTVPQVGFHPPTWLLPKINPEELSQVELLLPEPYAAGYGYHHDDQPVLVEVWVEKSTMADVLVPVCRNNHVNYVEGKGFESITHVVELVRRAERHSKPAHILYVSDFDEAGDAMPVGVARQIQYWRETLGVEQAITLDPIVLTHDQVIEYQLPREPSDDIRAAGFVDRYGDEGVTELDALEALHPGQLAEIVRRAIREHQDSTLRSRLTDASNDASDAITEAWEVASAPLREEAERLTVEARENLADNIEEIARLVSEQLATLEPFEERAAELVRRAEQLADELNIELPARPEPEIDPPLDEVLFDSRRHWLDQLDVFKARKNGSGP